MNRTKHHRTDAWLLRGLGNLPGVLTLSDGRLSFVASSSGSLWGGQLRRLERDSGRHGLAAELNEDRRTTVFDVAVTDVREVVFPWYYFLGGVKLTVGRVRYRLSFTEPGNTKINHHPLTPFQSIAEARRRGRAWQEVLALTIRTQ